MDDLIAFVSARLDEDEAAAKAGARRVGMPWHAEPQPGTPGGLVIDELGLVGSTGGRYAAEHIARHDPARVLREVAAKRAIVAMYEDQADRSLPEGVHDGRDDNERDCDEAVKCALGEVLEHIAAVWSDHPDYKQEWELG